MNWEEGFKSTRTIKCRKNRIQSIDQSDRGKKFTEEDRSSERDQKERVEKKKI